MRFLLIGLFILFAMLQTRLNDHGSTSDMLGTEAQASPVLLQLAP